MRHAKPTAEMPTCTIVNGNKENLMSKITGVIRLLKLEQQHLTKEMAAIGAALAAFGTTYAKGTRTRRLSASARARIAAAQRARWAKVRQRSDAAPAKVVPIGAKRTLSATARRKIAAAQRARLAKLKAGKKTA